MFNEAYGNMSSCVCLDMIVQFSTVFLRQNSFHEAHAKKKRVFMRQNILKRVEGSICQRLKWCELLCLFPYLSQLSCYRFILSARHKWIKKRFLLLASNKKKMTSRRSQREEGTPGGNCR